MQAHVGEERNHFNVVWKPGDRKSRPSFSSLNHPLKSSTTPAPWLVGLMAFLAAMLFSGLFLFFPSVPVVPALLPILLYVALYATVLLLIRHWSTQSLWNACHHLALASGALIETMIFGFLLVSRGSLSDLIFHAVLCVVILLLLSWIARRLRATETIIRPSPGFIHINNYGD